MSPRLAAILSGLILSALTLYGVGAFSPKEAKADHVELGSSCKEWAEKHPTTFPQPDSPLYGACTMTADMQKEFDDMMKASAFDCEGCPEVQSGFVAPAPGPAIRALINTLPRIQDRFATSGKGAETALQNISWRWMSPQGVVGGIRSPNAKGKLLTGSRVSHFYANGPGTAATGRMLVTGATAGAMGTSTDGWAGHRHTSYSWSGTTIGTTSSTAHGSIGVHCPATSSTSVYNQRYIFGSSESSIQPYKTGTDINNRTNCRFATWDFYSGATATYSAPRMFGPVLPPESIPGDAAITIGNDAYDLSSVDVPTPLEGAPPSGDTVMEPMDTRILYDAITQDPSYTAPAPVVDPQTDPAADPDHDGEPNETDPDDDNDGLPDPDDPNFTVPDYPPWASPGADPDGDGDPNETDPDDDGDGKPDSDDPYPYDPNPPLADPPADPDGDGIPNETDPDDDNDGDPDTTDPSPTDPAVESPDTDGDGIPDREDTDDDNDGDPDTTDPAPTDPAVESPDTDGDGVPDREDNDDDNDGTPDTDDPAPTDPAEDGDLDKDGILDPSDGDQDGDRTSDWEDTDRRSRSVPVPEGEPAADVDEDGVPDWEDPWPGNPYAPEQPTKDQDGDTVPDFQDPEITDPNVPMKPWAPGSPGDSPGNPGQTNIPTNPSNPNYPTSPNMPANPTDPTSTINPTSPISPSEPMPPGEAGGPPNEQGSSCPIPRKPKVVLPELKVKDVFPFSLVIYAVDLLGQLHGDPEAPAYEIPYLGSFDLSQDGGLFAATKIPITGLIICGLLVAWYMLIKGSEA